MSMTEAQKRDAYHEAQHILRLDKKWQHLMPGVAREIIRRALGQKVQRNQAPLDMHGLMHEHKPREAALIERTLKNGMYDPSLLHSFQLGTKEIPRRQVQQDATIEQGSELPDYEVFVHSHGTPIDSPSHYEPGTDTYHSSVHDPPEPSEVPMQTTGARLHSDYEAVH